MRRMKLRDAWAALSRPNGTITATIRRTRRDCKKATEEWAGQSWADLKKKGFYCIKVAICVEY